MKIGIFTFHRAENVGAALQVWALQNFLVTMGHEVVVIDYRCSAIEMTYDIYSPRLFWKRRNFFKSFKLYIDRIRTIETRKRKKQLFKIFRERFLQVSKPVCRIKDIPECGLYITGSDQVWSLTLTKGYDKFYFLDFPAKHKLSYAASLEHSSLKKFRNEISRISKALEDYDAISVREPWIVNEIQPFLSNKDINVCIDPVFLRTKEDYLEIAELPKELNYIFVYQVIESPLTNEVTSYLANKYDLSVIKMHARQTPEMLNSRDILEFGPQEFLGYIANAQYVITTSFHGLAFSLLFEKDFWVINTDRSNRQRNLLNEVGIGERLISSVEDVKVEPINYERVELLLQDAINKSKKYLVRNI